MKKVLLYFCCLFTLGAAAQTKVDKSYPVKSGQQVNFTFDRPKTIHIATWDKSEVSVKAVVSINNGENDSAFELKNEAGNDALTVSDFIRDMKNLPEVYTVMRDGMKSTFRSKAEFEAFLSQNRGGSRWTSEGVDIDISIDIKVPANTPVNISTIHGSVSFDGITSPITVKTIHGGIDAKLSENAKSPVSLVSTHGHVDVTMPTTTKANLKMSTIHGEILASSGFQIDMDKTTSQMVNFSNKINGTLNGGGAPITLSSTHNKIYLRKN